MVKGVFTGVNIGGNNWPLSINLPGDKYGFETGRDNSQFSISMRGQCQTDNNLPGSRPECDGFFVIGFGDNQYVTFGTDFDGTLGINGRVGLVTYPACGGDVATGNAANLLNFGRGARRDDFLGAIAGGNKRKLKLLSARGQSNGENFPITIEITNNDVSGTCIYIYIHMYIVL